MQRVNEGKLSREAKLKRIKELSNIPDDLRTPNDEMELKKLKTAISKSNYAKKNRAKKNIRLNNLESKYIALQEEETTLRQQLEVFKIDNVQLKEKVASLRSVVEREFSKIQTGNDANSALVSHTIFAQQQTAYSIDTDINTTEQKPPAPAGSQTG